MSCMVYTSVNRAYLSVLSNGHNSIINIVTCYKVIIRFKIYENETFGGIKVVSVTLGLCRDIPRISMHV